MNLPEYLRPSVGTLGVLGLKRVKMAVRPTTAYIMLGESCESNCMFCAQRRENPGTDRLSRVIWPKYPVKTILKALKDAKGRFSRICFQTLDYRRAVDDVLSLSRELQGIAPLSASMVPLREERMYALRDTGVEYLSIALDAANPDIFEEVKGSGVNNRFTWKEHWNALRTSVKVFGKGNTHLIVGLGESDEDIVNTMLKLKEIGVYTALFAYTPVNGGVPPSMERYRAIQLVHRLIYHHDIHSFRFSNGRVSDIPAGMHVLEEASKRAFLTSGCPGCNRPFYNERPGKDLYNHAVPIDDRVARQGLEMAISYVYPRTP